MDVKAERRTTNGRKRRAWYII